MARKTNSRTKKKKQAREEYLAIAVVLGENGKGYTLGRYGRTSNDAIAKVVKDAANYGTIATIAVYKNDKQILWKEYPIVKKLRVTPTKKDKTATRHPPKKKKGFLTAIFRL